jgi:hypothetical protein
MTTFFLFYAIPFLVVFMLVDLAIYQYRRKHFGQSAENKFFKLLNKLISPWLDKLTIQRVGHFVKNLTNPIATQKSVQFPISDPHQSISTNNQNTENPNNLVHVEFSADIPAGSVIYVTIRAESGEGTPHIETHFDSSFQAGGSKNSNRVGITDKWNVLIKWIKEAYSDKRLEASLLIASIIAYAVIIATGIERFPIYFFTDEAVHMNLAANFLRDGLENYFGEFLPTFFTIEGWVNGTSVYVQVLPLILFGKSVLVTRLVSALISLLGALAVSLLLKDALKLKHYWVGIFMVLTTPAWFLHAKTAFEYVEVASFYSLFLYFYSLYRAGHLRFLYWAIIAAALAFYTHGLGQILTGVSGIILFVIDFRYHTHPNQRKTIQKAFLLGVLLLLPFIRYYLAHPGEAAAQVKRRGSYWSNDNLETYAKLGEFFKQYALGLNPFYWYFKNSIDLSRHIMKDYGNGLPVTIPFFFIGLTQSIRNIKLPGYRLILVALLVCPIPASVVAIGMPRMLWMTIPIALLTTIGISTTLQWIETRGRLRPYLVSLALFLAAAGSGGYMLRDALIYGPTWFQDYSLYGMQYGAKQVFQDVVRVGLEEHPDRRYVVSPSWANGTEQFVDFFIPPPLQTRINLGQPVNYLKQILENNPALYFVTTPDEYQALTVNPMFTDILVEQILPYPNDQPGFYVLSLKAVDNIDDIIKAEEEKNRKPIEEMAIIQNQQARVFHSPIASGSLQDVFDSEPESVVRVTEANPFIFDIYPTTPLNTHKIDIQTGALPKFTVTIHLYAAGSQIPVTYTQTFTDLPPDPLVSIIFDRGPEISTRAYIEIKDELSGESSQIHVRTIEFK